MSNQDQVADVVQALRNCGFSYIGLADDGWFRLTGLLQTSASSYGCEITLDGQFFELPRIRLLEVPPSLRPVAPHLDSFGGLCYLAKGTVVLDIFDPVGQTLACLKRAELVLDKLLKGELVQDLEEEFFAYWHGELCLVDIQGPSLGKHQSIVCKPGNQTFVVATDDKERTNKKLSALGWSATNDNILVYRVRTKAKPRPSQGKWPPTMLKDVLAWQALLDGRCRKKIEQRVREAAKTSAPGMLILIESPLLTYGLGVMFDSHQKGVAPALGAAKKSRVFDFKVTPMPVFRLDDRYMAQRNIPGLVTLEKKQITVVGCGTIGGYLADMLVKAGAGTSGGQLTLVDPDALYPQNIGRHRLGFSSLFQNKAQALAAELRRGAPGADIRALPVRVQEIQFGPLDLLIDATGEESLGHWMASKNECGGPMLSVWIEGPGIAVRSLLYANKSSACIRCLTDHNRSGRYPSVSGDLPVLHAGQGCEGLYVPFSASVSVQAASLASEAALAWVNNSPSPALRTRVLDSRHQPGSADCDPLKIIGCPACSS